MSVVPTNELQSSDVSYSSYIPRYYNRATRQYEFAQLEEENPTIDPELLKRLETFFDPEDAPIINFLTQAPLSMDDFNQKGSLSSVNIFSKFMQNKDLFEKIRTLQERAKRHALEFLKKSKFILLTNLGLITLLSLFLTDNKALSLFMNVIIWSLVLTLIMAYPDKAYANLYQISHGKKGLWSFLLMNKTKHQELFELEKKLTNSLKEKDFVLFLKDLQAAKSNPKMDSSDIKNLNDYQERLIQAWTKNDKKTVFDLLLDCYDIAKKYENGMDSLVYEFKKKHDLLVPENEKVISSIQDKEIEIGNSI